MNKNTAKKAKQSKKYKKVMKCTPSERAKHHTNDETPLNTIEIPTKER